MRNGFDDHLDVDFSLLMHLKRLGSEVLLSPTLTQRRKLMYQYIAVGHPQNLLKPAQLASSFCMVDRAYLFQRKDDKIVVFSATIK